MILLLRYELLSAAPVLVPDFSSKDFSNPEVAKHLQFYPEETSGPISEVWQAQWWKDYKPSELTPMYSQGLHQFYIDELAQLQDGSYVVPRNWIICDGKLHADCNKASHFIHVHWIIFLSRDSHWLCFGQSGWCLSPTTWSVPATEFISNYEDITAHSGIENLQWQGSSLSAVITVTNSVVPSYRCFASSRDAKSPLETHPRGQFVCCNGSHLGWWCLCKQIKAI